ncbi:MAG TPA: ABC transporter permease [Pseudolabrys sp.]|jgi:putative ABC transport system permease protein|nr:ABC transporter permease [Pseudolabrys sp.]
MSLNFTLAARNLFHDRLRFIATAVGIVFSVVLVMVQMGLYLGFGRMVTTMIDHADADLWVMRQGTKAFEDPSLLDANKQEDILAVNGVASATPLVIGFSDWRLSSGEMTPVFLIGSNGGLQPWDVVAGSAQALSQPGAVAVDSTYRQRLGITGLGSQANIRGQKVHVAAVTEGIRSFTTTPYVFVDLEHARQFIGLPKSVTSYFLVKLKPGADRARVQHELQASMSKVAVLTTAQFRDRSRDFWLFGTGAGAALFGGALLGVIVGTVIVAQTLYSSTKDHIEEFATLRAMGSSNRYIYAVIIYQALLNAVIGFALASAIGFIVVWVTSQGALPVVITPLLMAAIFGLTIVMCIGSALTAILRVVRIDPAVVFSR